MTARALSAAALGAALLLAARPAAAVYSCGGVKDTCDCNANNPYPCCSNGGNCTWWAWHSMCCSWAIGPGNWGNAKDWVAHARSDARFEVRSKPVAGSVAVKVSSSYGHVAWVKSVQGSNIEVTEMACWGWYGLRTKVRPASDFDGGFIVRVAPKPDYQGRTLGVEGQSYPIVSAGATQVKVGGTVTGWVKLQNEGVATWKPGKVWLAPIPRDKPSPFHSASWKSETRISTVKSDVAPGKVGTFALDLTGREVGTTVLGLGWVADGVTWFADEPKGGGPEDGYFAVKVEVVPGDPPDAGPSERGVADAGAADLLGSDDLVALDAHDPERDAERDDAQLAGGCATAPCRGAGSTAVVLGSLLLLALALWRRARDVAAGRCTRYASVHETTRVVRDPRSRGPADPARLQRRVELR